MSDETLANPYDIAAGEIDGWRGRCVDLFAKAERAVALALEAACDRDESLTIRHLAGQRLADLIKLVENDDKATEKQRNALRRALDAWERVEPQRAYFAHGVAKVLLDKQGNWHAQFNFTKYQAKSREPQRWNCSKREAEQFETDLEQGFKDLSAQLGHFRKRFPG